MKLLIITDAWHPQVNGVVCTYEYLSAEMIKKGHDVKVIGPSDFPRTFAMPGYAEIRLAIAPYRRLKHLIEAFAPDAIHVSTEGPLGRSAQAYCARYNRPFTTSYHTQFPDYFAKRIAKYLPFFYKPAHALGKSIVRRFHSRSSGIFVATQSLEDELRGWGFTAPMNRLTRGVNLDLFYPGDKTLLQDKKAPVALYVGRVAIEKNIALFLEMEWSGTKVIVGDGPSMAELQAKYKDAIFVGKKFGDELAAYYRSSDVFVFPSKTDTFGIVLIEALASGLPVAAYDVTGPKDIVTKDFLGCLTQDDLSAAAHHAVASHDADDAEKRASHVKHYHTWEYAANQFEAAIQGVLSAHNK